MNPRSKRFDRGVGGPCHQTWTRTPGWVWMGLALLIVSTPSAVMADVMWQQLWSDDFESSMADGWTIETFGRGDRLELAREAVGKCWNQYLSGRSLECAPGRGYAARIPVLEELGLDRQASAYSISFRYRVPDATPFCWTMPLISPDANLVLTECAGNGRARLGLLENGFAGLRDITSLEVGAWHQIRVLVDRDVVTNLRTVRIHVDGRLVAQTTRSDEPLFHRISFMDLPVRPVDADEEIPRGPSCFGGGDWDDVRVMALQPVPSTGGRELRDIRVVPNPANPLTTVRFGLDQPSRLEVEVFDLRGRLVSRIFDGVHPAGRVSLLWRGTDDAGNEVASGSYLVRVRTPAWSEMTRATLTR